MHEGHCLKFVVSLWTVGSSFSRSQPSGTCRGHPMWRTCSVFTVCSPRVPLSRQPGHESTSRSAHACLHCIPLGLLTVCSPWPAHIVLPLACLQHAPFGLLAVCPPLPAYNMLPLAFSRYAPLCLLTLCSPWPAAHMSPSAAASTRMAEVFIPNDWPTCVIQRG